jgi:hypothetical protein
VIRIEDVRAFATTLPRTPEALVHDRVKFRVGRIVYLAFSREETVMGFAFPKEEREAMVRSEPDKFLMPPTSDLRYRWLEVRLDPIDVAEMQELVLDDGTSGGGGRGPHASCPGSGAARTSALALARVGGAVGCEGRDRGG